MPEYYIGSTSIAKINSGYRGSVKSKRYEKIWRQELREHPELFDSIILTEHDTRKEAFEQELAYQLKVNAATNPEYINLSYAKHNGFFGNGSILKGIKKNPFSNEHKEKLSLARKGIKTKPVSNETKEKLRQANLGKKYSEESKAKMSNSHKGKILSEDVKQKMCGKTPHNKGVPMSQKTKDKIGNANRGRVVSADTRQKLRNAALKQWGIKND